MLLRRLVVVGLVGFVSLTGNAATAEDAVGPVQAIAAIEGVSFIDPLAQDPYARTPRLGVTVSESFAPRFSPFSDAASDPTANEAQRRYELAVVASRSASGLPVDVAIAQRASLGVNAEGDIARQGRGSELRIGRGLARMRRHGRRPSWDQRTWYMFAASDDEAVTWTPGSNEPGGASPGFALQDRVEIGDMQAGLTYEAGPVQASLAYVQRKVSARAAGARTVSHDESFTGLTLTYRH